MIEVIDRIPTYPGRVKLIPVAGQPDTYDMVRADEPIEPGTPINKALFDSYASKIEAAIQTIETIESKLFDLSQRIALGTLNDGSIFGLYENGVLVPYIKVQSVYQATSTSNEIQRAVVLRLDCVTTMQFQRLSSNPLYQDSYIDSWLQNEFINTLDTATQNALTDVTITSATSSTTSRNISRKVFLLSAYEYMISGELGFLNIGTNMPYFSDDGRRVSNYNGSPIAHYTRSTYSEGNKVLVVRADGTPEAVSATTVAGVRPAMTLPITFEVTAGVPSTENVMATSEVI